ncbi:MAG TPA: NAD(P)H-hydrate dehydratase [Candidatus Nanoarchaeia archaeon]|nr:NAD(P)H-hydrate dehydratase [Candidatus Nanoarchaeia archaeon]
MKFITSKELKLKKRNLLSHKGENGNVLIIGGSVDYPGSPLLCARSALSVLRSGADMVTVAAPEKVAWTINRAAPDIITKKIKGNFLIQRHLAEFLKISKNKNAIQIGNGIGLRRGTQKFVNRYLKKIKEMNKNIVVDADAIKVVDAKNMKNCIVTPHLRELEIFLNNNFEFDKNKIRFETKEFQKNITDYSKYIQIITKPFLENNNVLLIKGKIDTIISSDRIRFNKTGNAGMTHAGCGDVLAGLTTGLAAQGNGLFESACIAAYINGLAGESLYKTKGYGYIASDLIEEIPAVMKKTKTSSKSLSVCRKK